MEKHRRITLLAATGALFVVAPLVPVYATGGGSFDEPAPSLGDSLDFLPGKSLGEIFLETAAHPSDKEAPDFDEEILKLAQRLRTEPAAPLVAVADGLLAQARQHYSSGGDSCNLLHDVRDVLAGSADNKAAAADYIKWRVENKNPFKSPSKTESSEEESGPKKTTARTVDLERNAREVSGPLKAHWLYLVGATTYRGGDRTDCLPWFERVVKEFPRHPRAEIALFMQARCWFSESRRGIESQDERTAEEAKERAPARKKAAEMFERYREQYPRGRFEADALGWLGALAFDGENYLKALEYYIAQAETPGHPETIKSAVFMCEKCLVRVAEKSDSTAAFSLIARHPRIAMGFTYLVLSAPEAKNYDGKYDQPADVKKWRRTMLPRIAAEVVKQKQIYQSGDWQPRYLAMLAQAASATGNQEQALQLTNLAPAELERSDDLLMVRALALQRAGKAAEAIETYRKFLGNFPKSPMAPGVRLRLAFALEDNHQAGEAVVELKTLLTQQTVRDKKPEAKTEKADDSKTEEEPGTETETVNIDKSNAYVFETSRYTTAETYPESEEAWALNESAVYPNITGADLDQVQQAIDTLLNFAPLTELATAVNSANFDEEGKKEFRSVIAQRYLAQEKFAEAKKFLPPAEFKLLAANLETLTLAAAGPPQEKAEDMLRLGNAWADARGKLLRAPLDTRVHFLRRYHELDALQRRANGRSLRLKNVDPELEERDELRHASRWWLSAARARPGTPLGAQARWKALEAMPKIAAGSEYAEQLAREIKGEAVSREIYEKLRAEAPDSVEAKRLAAYWSFPPPSKTEEQGFDNAPKRDANILGYPYGDFGAFGQDDSDNQYRSTWNDITKRIALLPEKAVIAGPAMMATEVRELNTLVRKNIADIGDATCANFLDDLAQFFSEPNITSEMLKIYVGIRFDVLESNGWDRPSGTPDSPRKTDDEIRAEIEAALKSASMQSVADYLEFSRIGLKAGDRTTVETDIVDLKEDNNKATYTSRDHAGMEKMARDFLKKYPHSRKREAALFVIARSVQALSRPFVCDVGLPVPGSVPGDDTFDIAQKSYQREAFDPKRVLGALDDYDREFPHGRYAAENRNLRAMTRWRMHEWGQALDLTLAQLDDKSKPDLQPEVAVRLANIFADLAQAEYRADLIEAIRSRPAAMLRLKQFLEKGPTDRAHPLRYLVGYLNDQLKLKAVASN
ncbi:MAG TPA: outer membrane protein assembly factor BamD [Chthoniobacterales bacterium]